MDEQPNDLDKTAFVAKNAVPAAEVPHLIQTVHASLARLGQAPEEAPAESKAPAVSVKKSLALDYLFVWRMAGSSSL
jgi:predicted transcriptional regulator